MNIEIDDSYIEWIKESNPELFATVNNAPLNNEEEVITEYINEVLNNHKKSYDDLAE